MEKATIALVSDHEPTGCPNCGGLAVYREVEPGKNIGACCSGERCWWSSTAGSMTAERRLSVLATELQWWNPWQQPPPSDGERLAYSVTTSQGHTFFLYGKMVTLRGGRKQQIYYFAREEKEDCLDEMPDGYEVTENKRTARPCPSTRGAPALPLAGRPAPGGFRLR